MGQQAGVFGASGFAGGELVRLLDGHPQLELVHLGAHRQEGERLGAVHPQLGGAERRFGSVASEAAPPLDVAFLALPHGSSARLGSELAQTGTAVVDLGSDFRFDTPARYRAAYGDGHPLSEELASWAYGLPELYPLGGSRRVAVPGCYPTAALLAAAPLLRAGLIEPDGIVIDALSGVSGAGRSLREDLLFTAVDQGVLGYGVGSHRHRPEIEMGLEMAAGGVEARVTFTPHLVPMQRGLLATVTARPAGSLDRARLLAALEEAYEGCPFVQVTDRPPQTRWVVGSNRALVTAFADLHAGTVVAMGAIDNLGKGAAGQAVQCANLVLGFEETAGLLQTGWMP